MWLTLFIERLTVVAAPGRVMAHGVVAAGDVRDARPGRASGGIARRPSIQLPHRAHGRRANFISGAGAIRGVIVEPASRRLEPVEVFRGVPYGAPPLRLAAATPPPRWSGTRLADTFAPVCPQPYPDISNKLTACVRSRPLAALLAVQPPSARFLAGWAPAAPSAPARALHHSDAFLQCALAVVLTTTESYHLFSENEVRHGFEEEHRNRILRTFVRNVYRYHRNEIFAAVRNEYTDWEKPIQHPINIRDATLEALSDAARLGSVSSESLPYFLGLPLVGGMPFFPRNYSRGDVSVAESTVQLLAAFAKTGDPSPKPDDRHEAPVSWPRYELSTQQYLSIVMADTSYPSDISTQSHL
ncbi:unnamed protein product [Leptidea sinapis]|uniref:Carboxylesterase type B domain-containing protein n=1 Tax=Leptidea sinapis TaxID=189913 RepID=A0A5E4PST1_9NEOP|nr:unnamed protein product [Leptidea sinapis]